MFCIFSDGGDLKIKNLKVNFWPPPFFLQRVACFSESRWTTHRQTLQAARCNANISADTQKQALLCCMRPWTLWEAPKATDWSGTKSSKQSTEIKLSWYQSIDKKHFRVHVKIEGGLYSVPKKNEIQKSDTFSRGWSTLSSNGGFWKI
jgi:hypothetical protein